MPRTRSQIAEDERQKSRSEAADRVAPYALRTRPGVEARSLRAKAPKAKAKPKGNAKSKKDTKSRSGRAGSQTTEAVPMPDDSETQMADEAIVVDQVESNASELEAVVPEDNAVIVDHVEAYSSTVETEVPLPRRTRRTAQQGVQPRAISVRYQPYSYALERRRAARAVPRETQVVQRQDVTVPELDSIPSKAQEDVMESPLSPVEAIMHESTLSPIPETEPELAPSRIAPRELESLQSFAREAAQSLAPNQEITTVQEAARSPARNQETTTSHEAAQSPAPTPQTTAVQEIAQSPAHTRNIPEELIPLPRTARHPGFAQPLLGLAASAGHPSTRLPTPNLVQNRQFLPPTSHTQVTSPRTTTVVTPAALVATQPDSEGMGLRSTTNVTPAIVPQTGREGASKESFTRTEPKSHQRVIPAPIILNEVDPWDLDDLESTCPPFGSVLLPQTPAPRVNPWRRLPFGSKSGSSKSDYDDEEQSASSDESANDEPASNELAHDEAANDESADDEAADEGSANDEPASDELANDKAVEVPDSTTPNGNSDYVPPETMEELESQIVLATVTRFGSAPDANLEEDAHLRDEIVDFDEFRASFRGFMSKRGFPPPIEGEPYQTAHGMEANLSASECESQTVIEAGARDSSAQKKDKGKGKAVNQDADEPPPEPISNHVELPPRYRDPGEMIGPSRRPYIELPGAAEPATHRPMVPPERVRQPVGHPNPASQPAAYQRVVEPLVDPRSVPAQTFARLMQLPSKRVIPTVAAYEIVAAIGRNPLQARQEILFLLWTSEFYIDRREKLKQKNDLDKATATNSNPVVPSEPTTSTDDPSTGAGPLPGHDSAVINVEAQVSQESSHAAVNTNLDSGSRRIAPLRSTIRTSSSPTPRAEQARSDVGEGNNVDIPPPADMIPGVGSVYADFSLCGTASPQPAAPVRSASFPMYREAQDRAQILSPVQGLQRHMPATPTQQEYHPSTDATANELSQEYSPLPPTPPGPGDNGLQDLGIRANQAACSPLQATRTAQHSGAKSANPPVLFQSPPSSRLFREEGETTRLPPSLRRAHPHVPAVPSPLRQEHRPSTSSTVDERTREQSPLPPPTPPGPGSNGMQDVGIHASRALHKTSTTTFSMDNIDRNRVPPSSFHVPDMSIPLRPVRLEGHHRNRVPSSAPSRERQSQVQREASTPSNGLTPYTRTSRGLPGEKPKSFVYPSGPRLPTDLEENTEFDYLVHELAEDRIALEHAPTAQDQVAQEEIASEDSDPDSSAPDGVRPRSHLGKRRRGVSSSEASVKKRRTDSRSRDGKRERDPQKPKPPGDDDNGSSADDHASDDGDVEDDSSLWG